MRLLAEWNKPGGRGWRDSPAKGLGAFFSTFGARPFAAQPPPFPLLLGTLTDAMAAVIDGGTLDEECVVLDEDGRFDAYKEVWQPFDEEKRLDLRRHARIAGAETARDALQGLEDLTGLFDESDGYDDASLDLGDNELGTRGVDDQPRMKGVGHFVPPPPLPASRLPHAAARPKKVARWVEQWEAIDRFIFPVHHSPFAGPFLGPFDTKSRIIRRVRQHVHLLLPW